MAASDGTAGRIDILLDAIGRLHKAADWSAMEELIDELLALDPLNQDGLAFQRQIPVREPQADRDWRPPTYRRKGSFDSDANHAASRARQALIKERTRTGLAHPGVVNLIFGGFWLGLLAIIIGTVLDRGTGDTGLFTAGLSFLVWLVLLRALVGYAKTASAGWRKAYYWWAGVSLFFLAGGLISLLNGS